MSNFPVFRAGTIFNETNADLSAKKHTPVLRKVGIKYPTRLNAMSINSAAIAGKGDKTSFPAGEVMLSLGKYIRVHAELLDDVGGDLIIYGNLQRKVLVKHAYILMCKALDISPSLKIYVDDTDVTMHAGLGSSGATIAGVCVSINEIYGNPIDDLSLIKYIANNYGEETESDEDNLKLVQCIGGSVATGLTDGSISIIAGESIPIMSGDYNGKVVLAIPVDYVPKSADELMDLEEKYMTRFVTHGEKYSKDVAFNLLHKGMPSLFEGDMKPISDIVFCHRFTMGSIDNCSFVYPRVNDIATKVRSLYENNSCDMLAMSSVGPAFFALVSNNDDERACTDTFKEEQMDVSVVELHNGRYDIIKKEIIS